MELITSCSFGSNAKGFGTFLFHPHFDRIVAREFRLLPSFPTSLLYSRVFNKVQFLDSGGRLLAVPIHLVSDQDNKHPRNIPLQPQVSKLTESRSTAVDNTDPRSNPYLCRAHFLKSIRQCSPPALIQVRANGAYLHCRIWFSQTSQKPRYQNPMEREKFLSI